MNNDSGIAPEIPVPATPTDDQVFYLKMLARHLCSRKGLKTLTIAESAEIRGDQKQKENKTQAFLNRYNRGVQTLSDYIAFWKGILKLYNDYKLRGTDLFDDPIMRQAFGIVYPHLNSKDLNEDTFIDLPLQKWFSIDPQRSKDVCRHYSGLWWIVRPTTTKTKSGPEPEFNLGILNIQPEEVSGTQLPLFKFYQPASLTNSGGGVTSQGRLLAFHSDQILLLGKRRGSQTPTQLSWRYAWDPDRRKRESQIQGAVFTSNTYGMLIQSYFHGCFVEGSEDLRGGDFEEVDSFLRRFLDIRTEAEMREVPTSVSEVRLLLPFQTDSDGPPVGISAINGDIATHRPVVPSAGFQRLRTSPQEGPILTIA